MLNIDKSSIDKFNRYKMPRLETKVEGRGNGIKTVLCNITDVARSLNRPPTYPTKYLGCVLGAQTIMKDNVKYVVNGQHESSKLQTLLYEFIEKYVLCSKCRNPETALELKKNDILLHCKACGKFTQVEEKKDRSYAYIRNHPPTDVTDTYSKEKRTGGKEPHLAEPASGNVHHVSTSDITQKASESNESDFYQTGVIEAEDEKEEYSKYFSSLPSKPDSEESNKAGDEKWSVNVDDKAMQQSRMKELCGGMSTLTYSEELDLPMSHRMEIFRTFVQPRLSDTSSVSLTVYQDIIKELTRLEIDSRAIGIICEVLFVNKDVVLPMIHKHSELFRLMISRGRKVEKCFIGIMEAMLKNFHDLIPRINDIFGLLFELDLISEEVFLNWYRAEKSEFSSSAFLKKLQNASKDFKEWLENAEDENSSADDNDTEDQPESQNQSVSSRNNGHNGFVISPMNGQSFHSVSHHVDRIDEELEHDIDAI